jgi:hypothetical protein
VPVSGYNPMTSQDALGTVTALRAIDAESLVLEAASESLSRLGLPPSVNLELSVTVATPGMWTDRLATEIEHRLTGRTPTQVLFWTGEDVTLFAVRREAVAQTVRAALSVLHGPAETAALAAGQEGLACALADVLAPAARTDAEHSAVAEALAVVGSDTTLATKAALLYGDHAAEAMGWTPLGIPPHAGYRHATARAHAALASTPPATLAKSRWTPGTRGIHESG